MEIIEPARPNACDNSIEIRNLWLWTKEIDKTQQLNVLFQDDEDKAARSQAMDEIKNRF